ncbi:hypothetical protein THASP1DRAFT_31523 [Thamnocephalis sphaerospora]|uniref:Integral membrane protein n=1 Tax=Thamnocephalis sphaerospora TaxID=78915 RepID=A0A4V1IW84_9FUNG|nr:hypothetical protein THASP1DRAFT_31523 [Thamnocephalis sphaerospora]|eukprot:RKP06669.1 hypothetical protein THASP1DRAFT_31523 [Thamnocephalis sphaerospora]
MSSSEFFSWSFFYSAKEAAGLLAIPGLVIFACLGVAHIARFAQTKAMGHVVLVASIVIRCVQLALMLISQTYVDYLTNFASAAMLVVPVVYLARWSRSMAGLMGPGILRVAAIVAHVGLAIVVAGTVTVVVGTVLSGQELSDSKFRLAQTAWIVLLGMGLSGVGTLLCLCMSICLLGSMPRTMFAARRTKYQQMIRLLIMLSMLFLEAITRLTTPFLIGSLITFIGSLGIVVYHAMALSPRDALQHYAKTPDAIAIIYGTGQMQTPQVEFRPVVVLAPAAGETQPEAQV